MHALAWARWIGPAAAADLDPTERQRVLDAAVRLRHADVAAVPYGPVGRVACLALLVDAAVVGGTDAGADLDPASLLTAATLLLPGRATLAHERAAPALRCLRERIVRAASAADAGIVGVRFAAIVYAATYHAEGADAALHAALAADGTPFGRHALAAVAALACPHRPDGVCHTTWRRCVLGSLSTSAPRLTYATHDDHTTTTTEHRWRARRLTWHECWTRADGTVPDDVRGALLCAATVRPVLEPWMLAHPVASAHPLAPVALARALVGLPHAPAASVGPDGAIHRAALARTDDAAAAVLWHLLDRTVGGIHTAAAAAPTVAQEAVALLAGASFRAAVVIDALRTTKDGAGPVPTDADADADADADQWPPLAVLAVLVPLAWVRRPHTHAAGGSDRTATVTVAVRRRDGGDAIAVAVVPQNEAAVAPCAATVATSVALTSSCGDAVCLAWHRWCAAQFEARWPRLSATLVALLRRAAAPENDRRGGARTWTPVTLWGFPDTGPDWLSSACGADAACAVAVVFQGGGPVGVGRADVPLAALGAALAQILPLLPSS